MKDTLKKEAASMRPREIKMKKKRLIKGRKQGARV